MPTAAATIGSVFRELDPKSTGIIATASLPAALIALGVQPDSPLAARALAGLTAGNVVGLGLADFRRLVKALRPVEGAFESA